MRSYVVLMILLAGLFCYCHGKKKEENMVEIIERLVDLLAEQKESTENENAELELQETERTQTSNTHLKRQNSSSTTLSDARVRRIIRNLTREALIVGRRNLTQDFKQKYEYLRNGTDTLDGHDLNTTEGMFAYNSYTPKEADEIDNHTTVSIAAYVEFLTRVNNLESNAMEAVRERLNTTVEEIWKAEICKDHVEPDLTCDAAAKFRTIDGSCNNLENPKWGQAVTPQVRIVGPSYSDEYNLAAPRTKSVTGSDLPSPRTISVKLMQRSPNDTSSVDDDDYTVVLTAMGQFFDHDFIETPLSKGFYHAEITCCVPGFRFQCADIPIPSGDKVFKDCMPLTRSSGALADPCVPGPREFLNDITTFIDGSGVYGSDHNREKSLKDSHTGLLVEGFTRMPPNDSSGGCRLKNFDDVSYYCPSFGDLRGSEMHHLTLIHLLFLRVHNTLATKLRNINRCWSAERVYQETRKIVGAILQKIAYEDYLPLVVGPAIMDKYGLYNSYAYDPSQDPGIILGFSTAAYRFGHTLVTQGQGLANESSITEELDLQDLFFDPHLIFSDPSGSARWAVKKASEKSDSILAEGLTNRLFETENNGIKHALDLAAINVQRGRDHGVPGYTTYREHYSLDSATLVSINDLPHHSDDAKNILSSLYEDVNDIDLFAGGISEDLLPGAHVGETFANLIADQFRRLRNGDRFFYENLDFGPDNEPLFSEDQRAEIKSVTLSRLLCREFSINTIQLNSFLQADNTTNPQVPCTDLADIDLEKWRDREADFTNGGDCGFNDEI